MGKFGPRSHLMMPKGGRTSLSPKGIRKIGKLALREIYQSLLRDKPGAHESDQRGLTDILEHCHSPEFVDSSPLAALVQPTHIPNLWILPRGPQHADMAGLLHATDLNFLLQRFRTEFDLILIDTPPMSLYSDARALGRLSDGLIMVVRANTNSREDLRSAYQKLVQDQIPVLGTILNDWKMNADQARYYGRYQHYHEQPLEHA